MRAYIYFPNGENCDELINYLIYHNTSKEARKMGISQRGYDDDFFLVQCLRRKDLDHLATGDPRIETDNEILRSAGWRQEGETPCGSCELYALGMDKHDICFSCDQCPSCGHDEACEGHS